jgi:hypothetical protein
VGALVKPNRHAQRTPLFGQVSGYRLDLTQALIATEVGKLLPQLIKAINVLEKADTTIDNFFNSLWMNTMKRCTYPHGEALA